MVLQDAGTAGAMSLLLPLHNSLPFLCKPSTFTTANPTSTRCIRSDLAILCLCSTTTPPAAGSSPPESPTLEPSFHEKERGRREPVGNIPPRPWLDAPDGIRRLARTIVAAAAAAAAAALLCLGSGMSEANMDDGRRFTPSFLCEDLAGYYSGLDGLEGTALMRRLGAIVSVHQSLAYKEVWDALKILDAADPHDPENSPEVIEIYSLRAVPKSLAGKPEGWNREHLWPHSFGLTDKRSLTDLHNLRPADVNVNSSRGNKYYGECSSESTACLRPANSEAAPDTETDTQRWAPPFQVRGDVARSLMYMAVCYGFHQPGGGPHLQLSNSPSIENREMGLLSALLEWNELDPPSEAEKLRNERICRLYQHNRNPFIDHPEYSNIIWKQTTPSSKTYKISSKAWINEFHYDNKGKDQNEFVEIAADSSLEANKLMLLLYNGSTGKVYKSLLLGDTQAFTVSNSVSTFLIYTASLPLQNGPDGIALVSVGNDDQSEVIQFLSYEDTFKATDGPARGIESVGVNVQETEASSEHDSLGLTGMTREEFVWKKFKGTATPGKPNIGQRL